METPKCAQYALNVLIGFVYLFVVVFIVQLLTYPIQIQSWRLQEACEYVAGLAGLGSVAWTIYKRKDFYLYSFTTKKGL